MKWIRGSDAHLLILPVLAVKARHLYNLESLIRVNHADEVVCFRRRDGQIEAVQADVACRPEVERCVRLRASVGHKGESEAGTRSGMMAG